jgi:N-acetylmuramoyl-L-alanine amidase
MPDAIAWRPSPNHGPRPAGMTVDVLMVHYTGMPDAAAALDRLCDPAAAVSAHYVIDEDGRVTALVPEHRRAWHAGRGIWRGCTDLNSRSIGIELVNPGHEWGYRRFPDAQMAAFADLARAVMGRHGIRPDGVIGHSDAAPARKEDPGELFDWHGLAQVGIGVWPEPGAEDDIPGHDGAEAESARLLAAWGYGVEGIGGVEWGAWGAPLDRVITAFQRRFVPTLLSGRPCPPTLARLRALARQYPVVFPGISA